MEEEGVLNLLGLLTGREVFGYGWLLGAVTGALAFFALRNGWKAAGLAMMTVPAWRTLLDVLPDLALPFVGGVTFTAIPVRGLSDQYTGSILFHLAPIVAGFLLWSLGDSPDLLRRPSATGLAAVLRRAGVPLGKGEARSLGWGLAGFPLLALANYILLLATSNPTLQNSNESDLWANMTPFHAVAIAAAAAFGEELLYRGVILVGLAALARMAFVRVAEPARSTAAFLVAIVLQAALFGFAHAGYANLQHLLFAVLFGALSGLVAWRFGLWTAIALHFLNNLFVFGLDIRAPWAFPALLGLFLLLAAFSIVFFAARLQEWRAAGGGALKPIK